MGREIRQVPPNWEHPRQACPHSPWACGCTQAKESDGKCFHPMHDSTFREAAQEWKDDMAAWERGERPDYASDGNKDMEYWEWAGAPPDREYYRPEWPEGSATWFQVYETVSEGTPITPPFATKAELIDWLCTNKDFWNYGPLSRVQAEAFVRDESVPSLVISNGQISQGMEISAALDAAK